MQMIDKNGGKNDGDDDDHADVADPTGLVAMEQQCWGQGGRMGQS